MDVNASRFHFINTAAQWNDAVNQSSGNHIVWSAEHRAVTLQAQPFLFPPRHGEAMLNKADFRGADCDRYGNFYWIGEDQKTVHFQPARESTAGLYWSIQMLREDCTASDDTNKGEFHNVQTAQTETPLRLSGLAITRDHYLLLGTQQPGGLLLFDLHAGGMPLWMQWPADLAFSPCDISIADDNKIVILDVSFGFPNARIWCMDPYFRVINHQENTANAVPAIFKSEGEQEMSDSGFCPAPSISEELAIQTDIGNAVAIHCLPDGSCLVLEFIQESPSISVVHRYFQSTKTHSHTFESGIQSPSLNIDNAEEISIQAHDLVFVADPPDNNADLRGKLYICDQRGNQSFTFLLELYEESLSLTLLPKYYPMHHYKGSALITTKLAVYYQMQQRWVRLTEKPQPRYYSKGTLNSIILDSEQTTCVWHRIILEACIPDDAQIRIQTRASEQQEWLMHKALTDEPVLYYRQSSELPMQEQENNNDKNGSWELLLQNAQGRYLEIKLNLQGNGRNSPILKAMRIYYPRFSYLKEYLPAVYQDDAESAHFLDRYLANVEGLFTEMEGNIAQMQQLFDSRTTPKDFLEWLADWLGVIFNPDWDDQRRRLFLDFVPLLYRWRGTEIGLRAAIGIAISPCPSAELFAEMRLTEANTNPDDIKIVNAGWGIRIVERYQLRSFSARALGEPDNEDSPLLIATQQAWSPEQGGAKLHLAYKEYLQRAINKPLADVDYLFPATQPEDEIVASAWRYFIQKYFSFFYAVVNKSYLQDINQYREFLARRYRSINQYNQSYGLSQDQLVSSFQEITLPDSLPADGKTLIDWIDFVSSVLAIKRNAHLFNVLVPAYIDETPEQRELRGQKAQQVVAREKPAQTDFDVKLYWALFRVGSARLGLDSIIGESSRFVAMTLNQQYLGQSYLAASHPFNIQDRYVTGRDRLQEEG